MLGAATPCSTKNRAYGPYTGGGRLRNMLAGSVQSRDAGAVEAHVRHQKGCGTDQFADALALMFRPIAYFVSARRSLRIRWGRTNHHPHDG
jgi:hypothetical protein